MIGKTLGHYEILEKIGSGGMGEVYRARDTKLGRDVAIKVLPSEFSRDPERRKRFAREAQAIAALKHPIVTIYSVEEIDDVHFITMEFVDGETLAKRIPKDGLPLEKFFEYGIDLADAVSSAHEDGITHRDLKPANVMFDNKGRLKVLDFGLAKLLDASQNPEQAKTVAQGSDTAVGQILGTAAYMSPEQAEGKAVDHRSDIFSMGIILFEMATGERPFKGDTHISTISSVLKDTPPHVSEVRQTLPRHLSRIINRCLEKNPERRFQSAKDLRNDIEGLRKEIDSDTLSQTTTSGLHTSGLQAVPSRRRSWIPLAIVAAVIAIAVIAIFALRPSQRSGDSGRMASADASGAPGVGSDRQAAGEDRRTMAIVLPFENLGPPEDAYFAAGMTEEITTRLASVSGLGVISRTSATQYDRTGKTMKDIGRDLGVDYVLEGTVRWAKNPDGTGRVRITPQLIRVADDTHVWTETYDRDIDDIFEVQSDIAGHVIDQLGVTLLGSEREALTGAPTENMEAYRLYLQAKDLDWSQDIAGWDAQYVELMEQALALDPNFVEAWSELSRHHSLYYNTPFDKTDARLAKARKALQRAEELAPDHFQTHMARGSYFYYGFRDYDQALDEFLAATRIVPNEANAREMVGYIYRRQGKWAEAIENIKAALDLDPRDSSIAFNLGLTYEGMREFAEAERYYDRAGEIKPGDQQVAFQKATMTARWKGNLGAAWKELGEEPETAVTMYAVGAALLSFLGRDYAGVQDWCARFDTAAPFLRVARAQMISVMLYYRDGSEAARPTLERVNEMLEAILEQAPDTSDLRQWLAINLALLGRDDAAVREAKLVVDLMAKDQFEGPKALETLAQVYGEIGRQDESLDLIERLLKTVYAEPITPSMLDLDPVWDPVRDNPRFQALLAQKNI